MANENRKSDLDNAAPTDTIRLNKYLSECGIASRRKADELISEGAVLVNGKKVYELGTKITPGDRITVNGKPVKPTAQQSLHPVQQTEERRHHDGRSRRSPDDRGLFRTPPRARFPGRSSGLGYRGHDPSHERRRIRSIGESPERRDHENLFSQSERPPDRRALRAFENGVSVVGGRVSARAVERVRRGDSDKYDWIKIMIGEGKNRQVRRMFEKIGFDVIKLQRVAIGRLKMPNSLKRGEYVFLTEAGIGKIFEGDSKPKPVERQRSLKSEARVAASRTGAGAARPKKSAGGGGASSGRTMRRSAR